MAQVSNQRQTLWIRQSMREIISDFEVYENEGRTMELTVAEGYKWRLEMLSREMLALETNGELNQYEYNALECLLKSYSTVCEVVEKLERSEWAQPYVSPASASIVSHGTAGRPSFDISYSLLKTLLEDGFAVPNISGILGVSISTVRRRMSAFHLSIREMYTSISEDDLKRAISDIQFSHPNWGNRLMYGYLISIGIRVPFHRVREAQAQIDPEGSFLRRLRFLNRRRYSVPGPQWLWHIDGNHKLIRLGFVDCVFRDKFVLNNNIYIYIYIGGRW